MKGRVAVTGIGAVSCFGKGVKPLWEAVLEGKSGIKKLKRFFPKGHRTDTGAEVPLDKNRCFLTLASFWSVVSAEEAFHCAQVESKDLLKAGVFWGCSSGGMREVEQVYKKVLKSKTSLKPFSYQMYNSAADSLARHFSIEGPVVTYSTACTSSAQAIIEARNAILEGEIEIAIAGGVDSLCELTYAGFNSLRAVDPDGCKPFTGLRNGMSLGEGAGALVLESEERVEIFNKKVLAWVTAGVSTSDGYHVTAPHPQGEGIRNAISKALEMSGRETIDHINLHATGTKLNDISEWRGIYGSLGDSAKEIPLFAPKVYIGHLLGGAGGIESVLAVKTITDSIIPPTYIDSVPLDPEIEGKLVIGEPLVEEVESVLVINLAFGGSNTAIVFER